MVWSRYIAIFALVAVFIPTTTATMCTCAKLIALEITNIYENGDTEFHYDYCEDLKDGRGFTAGIAGFCTGTGDAWQVIQEYHKLTGGNDKFTSMDSVLAKYASDGSDSTAGLEDYLSTWEELGKSDTKFQQAQDTVRDDLYYNPAQAASNKLGLKLDISQGQIYDTGIEHGTGDDLDGMLALISATNKEFTSDAPGDSGSTLTINGHQVDEIVWLQKFIQVREADLKNPKEKENQGGNYWAQTTYRTKSYSYMIAQKEYMWTKSVTLLDNDGKPTTVSCSGGAVSSTRRKRGPDGRPIRVRRKRELVHSSKPPPNRRRRPVVAGKRNVEL